MEIKYRRLTENEISTLTGNGCVCEDWSNVLVAWGEQSYTDRIVNVTFSGSIRLGSFEGYHSFPGGISLRNGVRNAFLHNVTLGDRVLIRKTGELVLVPAACNGVTLQGHCLVKSIKCVN